MDRRFLEFWGRYLLTAAEGQKRLEEMVRLTSGGGFGSGEWTDLFRRCYGLSAETEHSNAWDRAVEQFQSSLKTWLALMNWVPREQLEALEEKCRRLEEKTARQQETIRQLETLLAGRALAPGDTMRDFSRLMEKQSAEFQKLMERVGRAMKPREE